MSFIHWSLLHSHPPHTLSCELHKAGTLGQLVSPPGPHWCSANSHQRKERDHFAFPFVYHASIFLFIFLPLKTLFLSSFLTNTPYFLLCSISLPHTAPFCLLTLYLFLQLLPGKIWKLNNSYLLFFFPPRLDRLSPLDSLWLCSQNHTLFLKRQRRVIPSRGVLNT